MGEQLQGLLEYFPGLEELLIADSPVILFAEPPLHAEIIINSSMMESLILGLPDWTTKTSFSRTLVKILTLVSPLYQSPVSHKLHRHLLLLLQKLTLENCVSSAFAVVMPRFSHICEVRTGHEFPAKMSVLRIVFGWISSSLHGKGREPGA